MSQPKEFCTNSLKSTFLWDVWFGRDAVYFNPGLPVKILMRYFPNVSTLYSQYVQVLLKFFQVEGAYKL